MAIVWGAPPPYVLLPASFDAVGAGAVQANQFPTSQSETHVISGNCVIVAVSTIGSYETGTATVGSTPMTSLGSAYFDGSSANGGMQLFYLLSPPTGSQTITVSWSTAPGASILNSMSFSNVASVGALQATSGNGTSLVQSVSSSANGIVAQAFSAYINNALTVSSYNQTQVANQTADLSIVIKQHDDMVSVLGYATGAPSVSFAATGSTAANWSGAAVSLVPLAPISVQYDAIGTGGNQVQKVTSLSWAHTATAGAQVLCFITVLSTPTVSSVTYGSSPMTLLGSVGMNGSTSNGIVYAYGLSNAPGGAQSVSVTLSASAVANGNTVSYTNVGSVGALSTVTGTSPASQTVTCSINQMIVQSFGAQGPGTGASGGTTRYFDTNGGGVNAYSDLSISDTTSNTTFTLSGSYNNYAGISIILS